MKLAKISLATLVALGAFSSVASATPLEEAIKNVDVSGMARYRYTNTNTEEAVGSKTGAGHQFKFIANFKAAIDDNFFGVIGLRYNKTDGTGSQDKDYNTDKTNVNNDSNLGIHQFYLGYTYANTTITAGKQTLGTFFTDDAIGTGVKVLNKDVEGLTLAAIVFDGLENDKQESDGGLYDFEAVTGKAANKDVRTLSVYDAGNLYGVAAIGSYDPISFQLWYASLENLTDLLALELAGDFDVTNDVNIGFKGQFVNSDANSDIKNAGKALGFDYNDGKFYAGELSGEFFGVSATAGYIGYDVKNKGVTSFSLEDQGSLIDVAEQFSDIADYTLAEGKGNFWFAKLGYGIDKFKFSVDYVAGTVKYTGGNETDYQEVMPAVAYQYNKKLKFSTFYSWANIDKKGEPDRDSQKYRFEARYSF